MSPPDTYDRRATLERAIDDGRHRGPCYLLLLLGLERLLATIRRFRQLHGGECDPGEDCPLCYEVGPLEYMALSARDALESFRPSAVGDVRDLEGGALDRLEALRFETLLAVMNGRIAEYEAELAEGEALPEPHAVCCEGGAR
jgi:hypothetical protein